MARRPIIKTDIQDYIIKGIISGEFKPGAKIPTGTVIAKKFGCTQHSVSDACRDLQNRGFLFCNKNDHGKGTFVSQELAVNPETTVIKPEKKRKPAKQEIEQPKVTGQLGFSVTPLADGGLKFQFSNS